MEFFSWRQFANRREAGALAGLTLTPYQSGDAEHEQGIAKAGNRRMRTMALEIAWAWLRYQPTSALASWPRVVVDVPAVAGAKRGTESPTPRTVRRKTGVMEQPPE